MNHRISHLKLADVQSASNYLCCNEWLFQEAQCRVSQLQLEFIIIAVASWFACKIHAVCMFLHNSYIAIRNALLNHIDAHMKMSTSTYAVKTPTQFLARLNVGDKSGCPLFAQASNLG